LASLSQITANKQCLCQSDFSTFFLLKTILEFCGYTAYLQMQLMHKFLRYLQYNSVKSKPVARVKIQFQLKHVLSTSRIFRMKINDNFYIRLKLQIYVSMHFFMSMDPGFLAFTQHWTLEDLLYGGILINKECSWTNSGHPHKTWLKYTKYALIHELWLWPRRKTAIWDRQKPISQQRNSSGRSLFLL